MVVLEFNKDLIWVSDWIGEEVGYPEIDIVGLYRLNNTDVYFYINMSENTILEGWTMEDEI